MAFPWSEAATAFTRSQTGNRDHTTPVLPPIGQHQHQQQRHGHGYQQQAQVQGQGQERISYDLYGQPSGNDGTSGVEREGYAQPSRQARPPSGISPAHRVPNPRSGRHQTSGDEGHGSTTSAVHPGDRAHSQLPGAPATYPNVGAAATSSAVSFIPPPPLPHRTSMHFAFLKFCFPS